MSFINFITNKITLPLSDFITSQSISRDLKFLLQSQYWSRNELIAYQNEQLQKLIHHSYTNVPFYKDLFNSLKIKPEDIKSIDDLYKIPIITKQELKDNQDKLLAQNLNKKHLIFASSSGSTGEPFQFYTTKDAESMLKAAAIRAWYWMGYNLGDSYVKISMNPRSSYLKKIQDRFNNSLYLSSTQLTPEIFEDIINKMMKFDPKFIRCYPVPLEFLADQLSKSPSFSLKSLKAINTTGSTLSNSARDKIEKVFGVKIFDTYSCEGGTIFSQCSNHSCYHPAEEYAIAEFVADNFSSGEEDAALRHITTDLFNYASPFIRYDTQDYIVMNKESNCACKHPFQKIKKIKGRDSDILKTPSGKYLIVENFVAYFEWIPEVDQIQIIQNEINNIDINIIVNKYFSNEIYEKIHSYWTKYIGDDVVVSLNIVKEIKLTPTGKRRTVIRNPKVKIND